MPLICSRIKKVMTKYSVKQLSKLAGVSIRTLHHYDQIGLLRPAFRSEKGYRYYQHSELLRLQQILFYRELGFQLNAVAEILNDPDFDLIKALQFHRRELHKQADRVQQLLVTIDKTIHKLKNEKVIMEDKELYAGFTAEEVKKMRAEVTQRWGEKQLLETEARIRQLGADGWQDNKKKGEEITQLLADLMDLDPGHAQVQEAIGLYHKHLNFFYEVTKERYRCLAKMYTEDERFKAHYEKYRTGKADYLYKAIGIYCDNL